MAKSPSKKPKAKKPPRPKFLYALYFRDEDGTGYTDARMRTQAVSDAHALNLFRGQFLRRHRFDKARVQEEFTDRCPVVRKLESTRVKQAQPQTQRPTTVARGQLQSNLFNTSHRATRNGTSPTVRVRQVGLRPQQRKLFYT